MDTRKTGVESGGKVKRDIKSSYYSLSTEEKIHILANAIIDQIIENHAELTVNIER